MGFSRQEYWSGLLFPSPVRYTPVQNNSLLKKKKKKHNDHGTSLVVQWLRLCLPVLGVTCLIPSSQGAQIRSNQISSVTQSCPTLCDPMNRSMPGLPVHHQLPEFTQTHVHRVSDAIQPSHPLSSPSPQSLPASESFPKSQLFT